MHVSLKLEAENARLRALLGEKSSYSMSRVTS
jgi:hypothetical protein